MNRLIEYHASLFFSKDRVKDEMKMEEEADKNKPKKVPLSLEEILAKKKADEEAQSKVSIYMLFVAFHVALRIFYK